MKDSIKRKGSVWELDNGNIAVKIHQNIAVFTNNDDLKPFKPMNHYSIRMWNTTYNKFEMEASIEAAWFEGIALLNRDLTPNSRKVLEFENVEVSSSNPRPQPLSVRTKILVANSW